MLCQNCDTSNSDLNVKSIFFSSLVKVEPITSNLVDLLERLSLVELNNEQGLERLKAAIKSANKLNIINTEGVEPLDSVLENRFENHLYATFTVKIIANKLF